MNMGSTNWTLWVIKKRKRWQRVVRECEWKVDLGWVSRRSGGWDMIQKYVVWNSQRFNKNTIIKLIQKLLLPHLHGLWFITSKNKICQQCGARKAILGFWGWLSGCESNEENKRQGNIFCLGTSRALSRSRGRKTEVEREMAYTLQLGFLG